MDFRKGKKLLLLMDRPLVEGSHSYWVKLRRSYTLFQLLLYLSVCGELLNFCFRFLYSQVKTHLLKQEVGVSRQMYTTCCMH